MMFRSKKGIFFTLIAILMVTVFFVAFTPKSGVTLNDRIPVLESKVAATNDYVELVRTAYIPAAMRSSSYNALAAISEYQKQTGARFADYTELNAQFTEVMLNGSMECGIGAHRDIETCICNADPSCADPTALDYMRGRNLTQRLRDVVNLSVSTLNIWSNFSYGGYNVKLYQNNETGPFQVGVNLTINFSATNGVAWWNFTENMSAVFSIEGIEDPLYSVMSPAITGDGTVFTNVFNETNLTTWNLTNTFWMAESRRYRFNPNGSSFLGRFTGIDEGSTCCGIESLINPFVMNHPNIYTFDEGSGENKRSFIDWCFFGSRCPDDVSSGRLFNITCITDTVPGDKFVNFYLDSGHIAWYNLTPHANLTYDEADTTCGPVMQAVCEVDPDVACI